MRFREAKTQPAALCFACGETHTNKNLPLLLVLLRATDFSDAKWQIT
jgi:hypothetical protein